MKSIQIINVLSPLVSAPRGRIWACDSSLEPLSLPYEQSMGEIRFARAVRPQRTKLCFLLNKAALNGHFEANMNCR